ncbi:unnamed protein product [Rangifer tarandus platyrhynchus]|uniref:Uncharacterized protein n=1 Tax=Rangifer tarandus platyrhynchus TaxID=3082113 RepID=A0ABN8ZTF4_RANTA|nr:unnamed protein product [Rangifer tarandus platyrhynchus]
MTPSIPTFFHTLVTLNNLKVSALPVGRQDEEWLEEVLVHLDPIREPGGFPGISDDTRAYSLLADELGAPVGLGADSRGLALRRSPCNPSPIPPACAVHPYIWPCILSIWRFVHRLEAASGRERGQETVREPGALGREDTQIVAELGLVGNPESALSFYSELPPAGCSRGQTNRIWWHLPAPPTTPAQPSPPGACLLLVAPSQPWLPSSGLRPPASVCPPGLPPASPPELREDQARTRQVHGVQRRSAWAQTAGSVPHGEFRGEGGQAQPVCPALDNRSPFPHTPPYPPALVTVGASICHLQVGPRA